VPATPASSSPPRSSSSTPVEATPVEAAPVEAAPVEAAPPADRPAWQTRCAAAVERARAALAKQFPGFETGAVRFVDTPPRGVRLVMLVPDRTYGRFHRGAPAPFKFEALEQKSPEAGKLGVTIGAPSDPQVSLNRGRYTKRRTASYEVNMVEGTKAFAFARAFEPVVAVCLR
jgi:hypothetical protein